eukprot:CAMPEP_0201594492 /NCGR_PEP_ID=MMETSP0190_2-20130828/191789_1 /ASSEMBLY_ACC=CAM_ASM_000263 /TAXON_ID=37353 /ORGANISM="Rosalina sp." /LENGTH=371 /DNA_ID=CAMNT_0048054119 /DNA_START=71 /DNA_END=1182 /DNA_ORIENTATION=+
MSQSYDKHDQKIIRVLRKVGLIAANKIAETLQGSIWRASPLSDESLNPKTIVIKVTNKYLQQNSLARIGKTTVPVYEDIISEAGILKYLSEDDKCPKSIVKFDRFFKTSKDYFLMMEDGGSSLFKFVTDAHKLIQLGKLEVSHWTKAIVIKVANKYLQENALARVGTTTVAVYEDVISEAGILKYLTEDDKCPKSIVKFDRFFKTSKDYFLMMEDGGSSLFKFVTDAHKLIQLGKLEVSHWTKVAKIISKQMLEAIEYIHSKNVCHFDLSLENFLINDPNVEIERSGDIEKVRFITDDIQIKLCDFGLAKYFKEKKHCLSTKFCGKNNYKSPEVLNKKKKFDAKQNDIWCLGVTLFMTCAGVAPWNLAHKS